MFMCCEHVCSWTERQTDRLAVKGRQIDIRIETRGWWALSQAFGFGETWWAASCAEVKMSSRIQFFENSRETSLHKDCRVGYACTHTCIWSCTHVHTQHIWSPSLLMVHSWWVFWSISSVNGSITLWCTEVGAISLNFCEYFPSVGWLFAN